MRRITPNYIKEGMVVGQEVYDNYGNLLIGYGTELTNKHRRLLLANEVPEIFIEDPRTEDVVVAPLFPLHQIGKLANAYRTFIEETRLNRSINKRSVEQMCITINTIIKDISLKVVGEVDVSHIPLKDFLYLQPIKTAMLSIALGRKLGIARNELSQLGIAALFKDIGFLLYPAEVVLQAITEDSIDSKLKEHPQLGSKILSQIQATSGTVATSVLQHHECWNGKGYPAGLKGKDISMFARIIYISDCFVNLLVDRPAQERYMTHQVIEYVMAYSGELFSPELVETFVRLIPCYTTGQTVALNTGETGVVSNSNLGFVARPVVRIIRDAANQDVEEPYDIDLAKPEYQNMLITKVLEYD